MLTLSPLQGNFPNNGSCCLVSLESIEWDWILFRSKGKLCCLTEEWRWASSDSRAHALRDRSGVGLLYRVHSRGEGVGSGRLAVAPDSSAECTVCAHSLLLPPGTRSCVQSQWETSAPSPTWVSKTGWSTKERGGKKKGQTLLSRSYFYFPGIVSGLCWDKTCHISPRGIYLPSEG